jgi:hypothetical protein
MAGCAFLLPFIKLVGLSYLSSRIGKWLNNLSIPDGNLETVKKASVTHLFSQPSLL